MKILQVISGLGNGGAEKFVVELSNELSANHTVRLCSFKAVDDTMQFPKHLHTQIPLISFGKKKGLDPGMYRKLYRLIKTEKPDVIHFHLDATLKYILPMVLLFPRIRFVYTIHSSLNVHKQKVFSQLKHLSFLTKRIRWVCIAEDIREAFEKAFPFLSFCLAENGITGSHTTSEFGDVKREIAALKKTDTTTVFISVGKLDDNKNQALLMEAMKELSTEDVIAVVIGEDPSPERSYTQKLSVFQTGNVHFLGVKNNVADYMACANAFVMTSRHEGLPIAALEAFSSGLPLITTPAGGMKGLVRTENGFVSKGFTKEDLLEVLRSFLALTRKQKEVISESNRDVFSSHYHISGCAAKYLSIYR